MFTNNHPTGIIKGWNAPLDGAHFGTIAKDAVRKANGNGRKRGTAGADANTTTTNERTSDMATKKNAVALKKVAAKKPAKKPAVKACPCQAKKATAKKGAKKPTKKAK